MHVTHLALENLGGLGQERVMYVFYPVRSFKLLQAVEVWMVSVTTCIIEICDPVGQELKVPVSLSSGKEYRGAPAA